MKIPYGVSDFRRIRNEGFYYVDKTRYLSLMESRDSFVFFVRPRRFGKSLMITALKEIFSGNRELFDGLAISKTDWKWEKWPVIHFNFGDVDSTSVEAFDAAFAPGVKRRLEDAGYTYDDALPPSVNFGNAIDDLSKRNGGRGVVILIDEYDAPVSHALSDLPRAESIRDSLSAFYSVMKDRTGSIRFLMMTGVSKFTKMSVFSCLNNIVDVSMDEEFATMLGYTDEELEANFEEHLRAHAEKMGKSYEDYRADMKRWCNGFRFSPDDETTVYNPNSRLLVEAAAEPYSEIQTQQGDK